MPSAKIEGVVGRTDTLEHLVTIGIEVAITLIWAIYFSESRVKQAAYAYAEMLLRACDDLR